MPRVLVADDDDAIRESLSEFLGERMGYDIEQAADGSIALRFLLEQHFDLAILDLRMPGHDGLDLLNQLRERALSLPVILFTGSGAPALPEHLMDDDARVQLLFKPVQNLETVAEMVASMLLREKSS